MWQIQFQLVGFKKNFLHNKTVPSIQFSFVDIELVSSLITSLDTHKATGADGISSQFIRASPYMARLLTRLKNKCIESSLVPRQWKQVNVTPVPKCKYCTTLSHLRPFSVLPVLSKVCERVLYDQIVTHLVGNNLLTPHQSGFPSGYSTQYVLLFATDKWLRAIDQG